MDMMKKVIFLLLISFSLFGCKDDDIEYVFPEPYFPAYPESYWLYSDGSIVKVSPGYHKHSYYEELETTVTTDEVYVPKIDEHYVYGYQITQNDNTYPLKKILSESNGEEWEISNWQSGQIKRKVIDKDTLVTLSSPLLETERDTFSRCIVVIEYYEDTIVHPWLLKEIYAPKVGMIRQEMQRDGDSLVVKELIKYVISQDI
jgi:hypothetical protein